MKKRSKAGFMAKRSAAEVTNEDEAHTRAFHVSGPRNVSSPNWKDGNYKRIVLACFVEAVYSLEHDRRENRTEENALAPEWWKTFKYKLREPLVDERDGSIYGAVLEWDRSFGSIRPSGAPEVVLALRGTILKYRTFLSDLEDNVCLALESLKYSVRFKGALKALNSYRSGNVCIAGHSLGAGLALKVSKALAKKGVFVEPHLFNPPSLPLEPAFKIIKGTLSKKKKIIKGKTEFVWKRFKSKLPSNNETEGGGEETDKNANGGGKMFAEQKWVPHLYVNDSDYICRCYTHPARAANSNGSTSNNSGKENSDPASSGHVVAKLFVLSKGKQECLEAHRLQQWWSDGLELQTRMVSL